MQGPIFPFLPFMIPFAGMLTAVIIVAVVFWFRGREKELQFHQDMRIREMNHQQKMKELELEVEKVKASQRPSQTA